jgi:hypothetical protein
LGTEDQHDGVSFDENVDAYGRLRHPRQGARKALSGQQQTFAMPTAHVNRYVLEGSVRPDGDLVRVSARLINAETGGPLWAERFDLTRSDIQQVQDDIIRLLSRTIDLKMIDARRTDREKPHTGPPTPTAPLGRGVPADAIRKPEPGSEAGLELKMEAQPVQPEDACARDSERLARLRADPTMNAIARFERELGCERLRPQLRRLRESVGQ